MKTGRSTAEPTKAQRMRFEAIKEIGCIVCLKYRGISGAICEIHHLNVGGHHGQRRRGHDFTIGLCAYHHRGVPVPYSLGPSFALHPRVWREVFGSDDELLDFQNELLRELWRAAA